MCVNQFISLDIHLSICDHSSISIHLSVQLSISLSIHPFIHPGIWDCQS